MSHENASSVSETTTGKFNTPCRKEAETGRDPRASDREARQVLTFFGFGATSKPEARERRECKAEMAAGELTSYPRNHPEAPSRLLTAFIAILGIEGSGKSADRIRLIR